MIELESLKDPVDEIELSSSFIALRDQFIENIRLRLITATAEVPPLKISIRSIDSAELDEEMIHKFSDFYTEIFRNEPYNQFLFHESDPLAPISINEVLGELEKDYYSIQETEIGALPEGYHYWVDREKSRTINAEKLQDDAIISFISDGAGDVLGLAFARKITLQNMFETEEMSNPLLFSQYFDEALIADEKYFFEKMKYHFGLNPDDEIIYFSCLGINPAVSSLSNLQKIMDNIFQKAPKDWFENVIIAETSGSGQSHQIFSSANPKEIWGILSNNHPIISIDFAECAQNFSSYEKAFSILRGSLKNEKFFNKYGYLPHPEDHKNIESRRVDGCGRGLFTTGLVKAGEMISEFRGEVYQSEFARSLHDIMVDHAIQIGEDEYVYGHKGMAQLANHGCFGAANCGIKDKTKIVALRDIDAGEEVRWDYRRSEDSNWVLDVNCQCGSDDCTKEVAAFNDLPENIKQAYLKDGFTSDWIMKKHRERR